MPEDLGPDGLVGVNTQGYAEDRPLHVVAWGDDVEGARILLEAGADPNGRGDIGETALHVAVRKDSVALAQLLLQHGADAEARSDYEDTPVDLLKDREGAMAKLLARGGT